MMNEQIENEVVVSCNEKKGSKAAVILLAILLALSLAALGFVYNLYSDTVEEYNQMVSDLDDIKDEMYEAVDKATFMDSYIVIVGDDGTRKYHKYGCKKLYLDYFYVFNIDNARAQGYTPCKKCCY